MENMIKTFVNEEFGTVRTLDNNGKVMFCGSDVAKALGYRVPKDAISAHCKGAVKHRLLTNGGYQEVKFIPDFLLRKDLRSGSLMKSSPPSAEPEVMWAMRICSWKAIFLLRMTL